MNHLEYSSTSSPALPYRRFPFIPLPIPPGGGRHPTGKFPSSLHG